MNDDVATSAALRLRFSRLVYGEEIRGVDFSGAELSSVATPGWVQFVRCRFVGADLRHATLDGASFILCNFSGADLRGASLRGAGFGGCDLTDADLRDVDLYDARLRPVGVGAGAIPTRLGGARLEEMALRSVQVVDVERD